MSLIKSLFGAKKPIKRVHVCSECGMPVDDHKEWCAVFIARESTSQESAARVATDS